MEKKKNRKRKFILLLVFLAGFAAMVASHSAIDYTSTNTFCESCHVHPHATISWKQGPHFDTQSGFVANCVDCHLPPPDSSGFLLATVSTGARDVWGKLFKDVDKINWQEKAERAHAVTHVYKSACLHCHQNLFPRGLSKKGQDAHLHYSQKGDQLRCLNCHLDVGHFRKERLEVATALSEKTENKIIFTEAAKVTDFIDFTETIPGSPISFEMVAIPGGRFTIGSPETEPYRQVDEGPQRTVKVKPFWMGKIEVSWREYELFYKQTGGEGRSGDQVRSAEKMPQVDAITGPTPAYGNPDQGWGRGDRPAITMTHFAAQKYCEWLSQVTGKTYRLPTEAEWEYACRGNTDGVYFFAGTPDDIEPKGFLSGFREADTSVINRYVVSGINGGGKTQPPSAVQENPFGLKNMLGNVWEFCSDWYAVNTYAGYLAGSVIENPTGPESGSAHVIRGGSYKSNAADLRITNRDHTRKAAWQMTDPQVPKSLWWYSDCNDVGFRVVCEYEENSR